MLAGGAGANMYGGGNYGVYGGMAGGAMIAGVGTGPGAGTIPMLPPPGAFAGGAAGVGRGGGPGGAGGAGVDPPNRSIYIGALPEGITAEQVLDHVFGGLIDTIRLVSEKQCAFVSFIYPAGAQAFFDAASSTGLQIGDRHVRVGRSGALAGRSQASRAPTG